MSESARDLWLMVLVFSYIIICIFLYKGVKWACGDSEA